MTLAVTLARDRPATVSASGDPIAWFAAHAAELRLLLSRHGAVLVTGLAVDSAAGLAAIRDVFAPQRAELREQFADCPAVGYGLHAVPDWGGDREMCLHHEQAHGVEFPGLLLMACLRPASAGGATLLGDTRAVLAALPPDLAERFRRLGWLLLRNYLPHFGVSWPTAFGTADPVTVEADCASRAIGYAWRRDGTLRTVQRRSAIVHHPATGQACWFNQIAFLSQWSLQPRERELLLARLGPDGIPFNTAYGDGAPLGKDEYDAIMAAYDGATVRVPWSVGDMLLVDNLLTACGREPYAGQREIIVALAEPVTLSACSPTIMHGDRPERR